jgi:hypothetical protein
MDGCVPSERMLSTGNAVIAICSPGWRLARYRRVSMGRRHVAVLDERLRNAYRVPGGSMGSWGFPNFHPVVYDTGGTTVGLLLTSAGRPSPSGVEGPGDAPRFSNISQSTACG